MLGLSLRVMASVLLIDDDTELSKLLEEYLQSEQLRLESAHDGPSGLEKALSSHPAVVVLDVGQMQGMAGRNSRVVGARDPAPHQQHGSSFRPSLASGRRR